MKSIAFLIMAGFLYLSFPLAMTMIMANNPNADPSIKKIKASYDTCMKYGGGIAVISLGEYGVGFWCQDSTRSLIMRGLQDFGLGGEK